MGWRGFLKGVAVTALLLGAVVGLWYGVILLFFSKNWVVLLGVVVMIAAFRVAILAFDWMWGRPPAFSKRPWERPWEQEAQSDEPF